MSKYENSDLILRKCTVKHFGQKNLKELSKTVLVIYTLTNHLPRMDAST